MDAQHERQAPFVSASQFVLLLVNSSHGEGHLRTCVSRRNVFHRCALVGGVVTDRKVDFLPGRSAEFVALVVGKKGVHALET